MEKTKRIVVPAKADDTGLIPANEFSLAVVSGVRQDFLEGPMDLSNLHYDLLLKDGEEPIRGEKLLQLTREKKAFGSLGFAEKLLSLQGQGIDIFFPEARGCCFLMPRTIVFNRHGLRYIPWFNWNGSLWVLGFVYLGDSFGAGVGLVVPLTN